MVLDVDSKPVAGATVAVSGGGPSTTTADDGSFKLAGVATGNVILEVTAEGFTAKQVPVVGATTALQLSVVVVKTAPPPPPPTRMIGGVVSDAATHAPIAGATVRVHGTEIQAVTAADGTFTLPGVATAEVALDVEAPNQPPTTATVPADRAAVAVVIGAAAPPPPTSRSIKGKIIDPDSKEPIVAAQVQVAGTDTVVFTEADGTFSIDGLPPGPVKLDISAPEHESHVLDVGPEQSTIEVPLALTKGEQIVIEGRAPLIVKSNAASGASTIDGKDLTRVSAQTLDEAMNGKLAGANLQSNSGAPGGGSQLRLRGISTINGQSSPLYVIDGVIISNVTVPSGVNAISAAAGGGAPSTQDNSANRLADLNPNDIENVEVLKGASAAALYGSKAANGVVVITTKRGRAGETHAEVTQRIGFATVEKTLGTRTFGSLAEVEGQFCSQKELDAGKCDSKPIVQAFINAKGKTYDHEKEIERVPFLRETLASVSGGNDKGNYFGSLSVTDEPGIVIGTFLQKQTGRVAVQTKLLDDRVHLGFTANIIHSLTDRGLTNNDNNGVSDFIVVGGTPNFVNLKPVNGVYPSNPSPAIGGHANSLQDVNEFKNREEVWRLITGSSLSIDAYKGEGHDVKLIANVGADSFTQKNRVLSPADLTYEPSDGLDGTSIDGSTTNLNFNVGAGAVWNFRPDDGSFRSALSAGFTYESTNLNQVSIVAQGLIAGQPNINSGVSVQPFQLRQQTKETGFYAQEEVALLDDRLSLLAGLLGERSSLNGDSDHYYIFPKAAAVYSVIQQGKNDAFDSIHVRGAYGETGNRPLYGQKFTPLVGTNNIDGNPGIRLGANAGDPDIKPERQREFEIGVDAALKDQKAVVELTGYQRSISDLLLQRQLATSTGFNTQFLNGGGLRNRGVEAALTVRPLPSNIGVDWSSRATLTFNRSEVTSLPDGIKPFFVNTAGFGAGFGAFRIEPGKSVTQIVATIDDKGTLAQVGDGEPDFRIGWTNTVTAGDWSFSALLDWQEGSKVINLTRNLYDANGLSPDKAAAQKRLDALAGGDPRPYIEDATFVKLREISITYTVPKSVMAKMGPVRNLSFNLSGRNLLVFTPYSGLDPEVSNFGTQSIGRNYDVAPYPPSRSYWLSVTAGI
ncbi:MAG TPA: carboxypeptidase regulatory-like domain-containing protein [Kofleriaceae bacterium]|nr:carboxypeptidase regulatory-like domain-containing protein [Kofleriaceae bacterium]